MYGPPVICTSLEINNTGAKIAKTPSVYIYPYSIINYTLLITHLVTEIQLYAATSKNDMKFPISSNIIHLYHLFTAEYPPCTENSNIRTNRLPSDAPFAVFQLKSRK